MKRKAHVIQITGLRGILMAIFVVSCLIAGFVGFPAFVAMYAWNWAASFFAIPTIGIIQGLMLWSIIAITGFIINDRKKYLVAFSPKSQLNEDEMKKIMEKIKMQTNAQMINSMILKDMQAMEEKIKKEDVNKDSESKDKENV